MVFLHHPFYLQINFQNTGYALPFLGISKECSDFSNAKYAPRILHRRGIFHVYLDSQKHEIEHNLWKAVSSEN